MSTLMQEYEAVYQKIKRYNDKIAEFQQEIDKIGARRDDEIPARIENLNNQLKKIDEYQAKIDAFKQVAEKHMISKNLPTIEAPPGYRVNLNRLRSWSMMIDPMAEDDSYAQRVFLVATCDSVFLEQKKTEFQNRVAELAKDYEIGAPDAIKELESQIGVLRTELYDYLKSDEFVVFAERVRRDNEANMYAVAPGEYQTDKDMPQNWIPGAYGTALDADEEARKIIKGHMGRFYDEKAGLVYLPVMRISAQEEFAMTVNCVPTRKYLGEMDAGIRNLIMHMIDESPVASRRVYVFDAVRQNSALIGSLKDLEGSYMLPVISRNAEIMQNSLEELVASFSDIDDMLGNYDTVIEYNNAVGKDKQIPRVLVVIVGWPNAFEANAKKHVDRIISNYERYGISFIAVKIASSTKEDYADDKRMGVSDYIGEKLINISMTAKETRIRFGIETEHTFSWYPFKQTIGEHYAATLKSLQTEDSSPKNIYTNHIDLDHVPAYVRGQKSLILPYGIDSKGVLQSVSFENEGFAAYLMGASGSGKSTLLHTLITDIIRNYHPDDVELWLADFKMSEFAQYMDPIPPHVKYILLDESQELVYDLVDKLTEKMMERQRFFMQHRDLKKVENIPPELKKFMPIIFVILDEFSIMSQTLAESDVYKLKLQNLLAKGRALGIKFIFSSQTFRSGIAGLTQTAKEQIQTRIAMKNSLDEIKDTLELTSSVKTEQVRNWMEALPPHYALEKYREKDQLFVRRNLVMFFPGSGDSAMKPQKRLIEDLRGRMREVDESRYGEELNTYVRKEPVIVDGNSYKKYDKARISKLREEWNQKENFLWKDVVLAPGDPRRMVPVRFISVSNESRQNILVLARNAEQAPAMSILQSFRLQIEDQGGRVHVWAYSRNRLYQTYKGIFDQMNVCEGLEEVCKAIHELARKIERRETGNDYYLLIGMEQLCADFELMEGTKGGDGKIYNINNLDENISNINETITQETSAYIAISEEQIDEIKKMNEEYADVEKAIEKMTDEWLEQGKSYEEIKQETERMLAEHNRQKHESARKQKKAKTIEIPEEQVGIASHATVGQEAGEQGAKELTPQEEVLAEESTDEEPDDVEEKVVYKPQKDFAYILGQGSRWGYHFVMTLNNYSDLKMTGAKLDWFTHRMAFQISVDDSTSFFGNRVGAKIPEHVCQYSNLMEQFSFRPFLHKGIDWDGWEVDDEGKVLDPANVLR